MALIPNRNKPATGIVGTLANMEEDNARTMIASAEFVAGIPVTYGATEMSCKPLVTASIFIGIALRAANMLGTPASDGTPKFKQGDTVGVADMGCVFVLAGGIVAEGNVAYYDPSNGKYYAASATGRLLLPQCEFDEAAAANEPVALRIRVTPGGANVTAA